MLHFFSFKRRCLFRIETKKFQLPIPESVSFPLTITRYLPNGYVATAGGVQEMELNAQTKHCSARVGREVLHSMCAYEVSLA